jgi:sugar (pentulose or hexulose) kinase
MAYFLTADGGTESLRARLYDLSGTCLASVAVPYETKFSAGARAEQDPADWWANFVAASRGAIREAGIDPGEVEAIAYATTCCSVVALDREGNALRPALIWMDVRAHAEADAVLATGRRSALPQRGRAGAGVGGVDDPQGALAQAQRAGGLRARLPHLRISGLPDLPPDRRMGREPR